MLLSPTGGETHAAIFSLSWTTRTRRIPTATRSSDGAPALIARSCKPREISGITRTSNELAPAKVGADEAPMALVSMPRREFVLAGHYIIDRKKITGIGHHFGR